MVNQNGAQSPSLLGRRVIVAVNEAPFSSGEHVFCHLDPLWFDDGSLASSSSFPPKGQIWWRLDHSSGKSLNAGWVGEVEIEYARETGDGRSKWQGKQGSWQSASSVATLWRMPSGAGKSEDWGRLEIEVTSLCLPVVYLKDNDEILYGTFKRTDNGNGPPGGRISLQPAGVMKRDNVSQSGVYAIPPEAQQNIDIARYRQQWGRNTISAVPVAVLEQHHNQFHWVADLGQQLRHWAAKLQLLSKNKRKDLEFEVNRFLNSAVDGEPEKLARNIAAKIQRAGDDADAILQLLLEAPELQSRIQAAITSEAARRAVDVDEQIAQRETELVTLQESTTKRKQELTSLERQIETASGDLQTIAMPALEALDSSQAKLLENWVMLSTLLGIENGVKQPAVTLQLGPAVDNSPPVEESLQPTVVEPHAAPALPWVESHADHARFVDQRLFPLLSDWAGGANVTHAAALHCAVRSCCLTLAPDTAWAAAYAEAAAALLTVVHVAPAWHEWEDLATHGLRDAMKDAARYPSRLHLVCLEGVNRAASSSS